MKMMMMMTMMMTMMMMMTMTMMIMGSFVAIAWRKIRTSLNAHSH
jgi:hypothetical protein